MEAAAHSDVGSKYGSLNQDNVLLKAIQLRNGHEVQVALVLDGHGMLGELAAKAAGTSICEHIEEQLTKKLGGRSLRDIGSRKLKEVINTAFHKAHNDVIDLYLQAPQQYSFPAPGVPVLGMSRPEAVFHLGSMDDGVLVYSSPLIGPRLVEFGTTASLALIENGYVVVAHVGDSDVVIGSVDDAGFVTASEMTKLHSAFSTSERFRIAELLSGRDNEEMIDMVNLREDGYLEVLQLGGLPSSVALGMTRALGHKHLEQYGVIPRPDIRFYDVQDDDTVLLLATDGVWDVMHPRDATLFLLRRVLADGDSVEEAVKELCESCVTLQQRASGAADNTSAVMIRLNSTHMLSRERSVRGGDIFLRSSSEGQHGNHVVI